jgi:hypothetical protein
VGDAGGGPRASVVGGRRAGGLGPRGGSGEVGVVCAAAVAAPPLGRIIPTRRPGLRERERERAERGGREREERKER